MRRTRHGGEAGGAAAAALPATLAWVVDTTANATPLGAGAFAEAVAPGEGALLAAVTQQSDSAARIPALGAQQSCRCCSATDTAGQAQGLSGPAARASPSRTVESRLNPVNMPVFLTTMGARKRFRVNVAPPLRPIEQMLRPAMTDPVALWPPGRG
jgi:hypothetical protein